MKLIVFCLFGCVALRAADDWPAILKKVAQTVAVAVERSDNYICAQELARFYYVPVKADGACHQPPAIPAVPLRVEDRLKLDVAVSQGSEIYSWHGAKKFSAASVSDVVRDGPISSGGFNGYLRNIFGEHGVKFVFTGRTDQKGLTLYHFDYDAPLASSHYEMQAGKGYVIAPFHGSFAARADNYELYSLTVTATGDQIPQKADICAASSTLTYQVVPIGKHESLLPASFDLIMGSRNGILTDSKGNFSSCREYTGESTVHFDMDDTQSTNTAPVELQAEPLKAGLFLPISLRTEIDEDSAYAGLPVQAVLTHNVKVKRGVVLAKGALLQGTVTRFQIFHQPEHRVALKIEFNSITDGNKLYLCYSVHQSPEAFLPTYSMGSRRRGGGIGGVRMQGASDEPSDGSMQFNTAHLHLDSKFTSDFITVEQPQPDAQQ